MDDRFSVEGLRVTVVGAARSGVAAARLLAARGARVTLTEQKPSIDGEERLRAARIELELGGHDPDTLGASDLVVLSPGVPVESAAVRHAQNAGVPVIGEVELASRWLRGRIVAITGTKGKSTTTTLATGMLQASGLEARAGGNIGLPLSDQVEDSTPDTLHVIEMSSFQLETTDTFHPWIAALLNFSADHLDRHPSLESYAAAKARIFERQTPQDWAAVNADDSGAVTLASKARARRRWFGVQRVDEGVTVSDALVVERLGRTDTPLVPVSAIRVPGRHILSDVLAAAAVSRLAGASVSGVADAVERFTGLEHAMEAVAEVEGVRFVNDSKATTIEAARGAIESIGSGLAIILGGKLKAGDFAELRGPLTGRARAIVAIGESAPLVVDRLGDLAPTVVARSMRDAVRLAFEAARPDGTVVLAPACASFDMFADFAERGRRFKEEVAQLAAERRAGEP